MRCIPRAAAAAVLIALAGAAFGQADNAVLERARAEKQPLLTVRMIQDFARGKVH